MKWERVGELGLQCGEYRVGKFKLGEKWAYVLTYKWERLMQADNFKECQQAAEIDAKRRGWM
jgi:hypothetical protein